MAWKDVQYKDMSKCKYTLRYSYQRQDQYQWVLTCAYTNMETLNRLQKSANTQYTYALLESAFCKQDGKTKKDSQFPEFKQNINVPVNHLSVYKCSLLMYLNIYSSPCHGFSEAEWGYM